MDSLSALIGQLNLREPAQPNEIEAAEEALDRQLPSEYLRWLRRANGAEGPIGERGYLILWPIGEVVEQTRRYADFEQFRDLVLIGTDGGGEAFCLAKDGTFLSVPFIGKSVV